MGMFDLPPRSSRVPSENILQIGNIFKKYAAEPDYYICYRAGYWARWLSMFFAVIVFSIVYAHHSFGFFPDIMERTGSDNYLELYAYLINHTGPIFIVFIAYYLHWFLKVIDFKKYNYFRDILPPNSPLDRWPKKRFRNLSAFCFISSLAFVLYPAIPTAFFYKAKFNGYFEQYFDSMFFIYIVSIKILIIQSLMAYASVTFVLIFLYINFEIKNNL